MRKWLRNYCEDQNRNNGEKEMLRENGKENDVKKMKEKRKAENEEAELARSKERSELSKAVTNIARAW